MCIFFDPKSYNECKEPSAELVLEKEKANFCDHFRIDEVDNLEKVNKDAHSLAELLFKK